VVLRFLHRRESAIFAALAVLVVAIGAVESNFLSGSNLYLVSRQISFVAIVALGELFVILHGGIDLSVGSIMALAGMVAGYAMKIGVPPPAAVLLGIAAGLAMGAINGVLISFVRIAPFIVTLGMLSFASGVVLGLSKGWPITEIPASFASLGQGSFLALPIPVWIMLALAAVAHVALSYTAFGRRTYAIGGNEQATFLSGIDVRWVKLRLYLISAGCASMVGIILVSRFNSAQADTGKGWELDAIAAAVIGGTSLSGGEGTILGTVIGAFLISILTNGLRILSVSQEWQIVVTGVIVVVAVYLDIVRRRTQDRA
jgi:ribose transport system permease protein